MPVYAVSIADDTSIYAQKEELGIQDKPAKLSDAAQILLPRNELESATYAFRLAADTTIALSLYTLRSGPVATLLADDSSVQIATHSLESQAFRPRLQSGNALTLSVTRLYTSSTALSLYSDSVVQLDVLHSSSMLHTASLRSDTQLSLRTESLNALMHRFSVSSSTALSLATIHSAFTVYLPSLAFEVIVALPLLHAQSQHITPRLANSSAIRLQRENTGISTHDLAIRSGTAFAVPSQHIEIELYTSTIASSTSLQLPSAKTQIDLLSWKILSDTVIEAVPAVAEVAVYSPGVDIVMFVMGGEAAIYVGLDMYKRNDPNPEPILTKLFRAMGGTPIESGVSVRIITPESTDPGAGMLQHLGEGKWIYVPTQAETDHPWFAVEFVHDEAPGKGVLVQVFTTPFDLEDVQRGNELLHTQTRSHVISQIFDEQPIEPSTPMRKLMRGIYAVLCGQSSGGGTPVHVYRTPDGSKERVRGSVDEKGNRLHVTLYLD